MPADDSPPPLSAPRQSRISFAANVSSGPLSEPARAIRRQSTWGTSDRFSFGGRSWMDEPGAMQRQRSDVALAQMIAASEDLQGGGSAMRDGLGGKRGSYFSARVAQEAAAAGGAAAEAAAVLATSRTPTLLRRAASSRGSSPAFARSATSPPKSPRRKAAASPPAVVEVCEEMCTAEGSGLRTAVLRVPASFIVTPRDERGRRLGPTELPARGARFRVTFRGAELPCTRWWSAPTAAPSCSGWRRCRASTQSR